MKQPGFTLIEYIIAVAIIGILAAIAIQAHKNWQCKENGDCPEREINVQRKPIERIPDCIRVDGKVFCERR